MKKPPAAPESKPNAAASPPHTPAEQLAANTIDRSPDPLPLPHQEASTWPAPPTEAKYATTTAAPHRPTVQPQQMVSLQSALLPEAASSKRPPRLSLVGGGGAVTSTATSRKRKRDGSDDDGDNSRGEVVDGIELNFDAAPLPPEWQRCLDIQSGQIHYYNTRTQKRTLKDPRGEPDYRAAPAAANDDDEEESANCAPPGLDLELNLTFSPRRAPPAHGKKKPKAAAPPPSAAERRQPAEAEDSSREMVAAVCVRCHMLVMMCRASPACPNCKFLHTTSRAAPPPPPEPEPAPLKLGLQLLCCRD